MLKELGFTDYQSKVYVALLRSGTATAKEIAVSSKVPTPKVYSSLDDLARQGVIDYYPSFPKKYKATDLAVLMPRLLERQRESLVALERSANDAVVSMNAFSHAGRAEDSDQFVWVCEGKRESLIRASELIGTANNEILVCSTHLSLVPKAHAVLKKAISQRDVSVKFIGGANEAATDNAKVYASLGVDIRFIEHAYPTFMVVDKSSVLVTLHGKAHNLLVSESCFASVFVDAHERLWSKATRFK